MTRMPGCGSLTGAALALLLIMSAGAAGRDDGPPTVRLAQAGSAGGVIGKQGKSAGGGEEAAPRRAIHPSHRAPPQRAAPTPRAVSGCARVPGNWSWFNRRVVVIRQGGTATAGAVTATWSCSGSRVTMVWSHGFTDRLTLSSDGSRLEGTNGFTRVWGNRL